MVYVLVVQCCGSTVYAMALFQSVSRLQGGIEMAKCIELFHCIVYLWLVLEGNLNL